MTEPLTEEAPIRVRRGNAYTSDSGRKFRVMVAGEPMRNGKHVDGTQLLLDLCGLHEKPARVPRSDRRRSVVVAEIERRGEAALDELGEAPPKRGQSATLVYESMGGEFLSVTLTNLSAAEARYVRDKSARRNAPVREVAWPSQSREPVRRVEHE